MASPGPLFALRVLSAIMGAFVFFMGVSKWSWLADTSVLAGRLHEWLASAPPASRWYLERVAIPGVPIFARLVPIAEILLGISLVFGFRVRLMATITLLMVLNFHFASDVLMHYSYLTNGYGPPVIGGLLALALSGTRLPLSVSK